VVLINLTVWSFFTPTYERLLNKHGLKEQVAALCTDTPAVNKLAWSKLSEKHPQLITFGCWAHVLQLFLIGG
jgi:hypothetical protein